MSILNNLSNICNIISTCIAIYAFEWWRKSNKKIKIVCNCCIVLDDTHLINKYGEHFSLQLTFYNINREHSIHIKNFSIQYDQKMWTKYALTFPSNYNNFDQTIGPSEYSKEFTIIITMTSILNTFEEFIKKVHLSRFQKVLLKINKPYFYRSIIRSYFDTLLLIVKTSRGNVLHKLNLAKWNKKLCVTRLSIII